MIAGDVDIGNLPAVQTVTGTVSVDSIPAAAERTMQFAGISESTDGNMGGIAGANAICATDASNAGMTGTFLAWLGDSTGADPDSSFTRASDYVLRDLTPIGATYADLTDGSHPVPIDQYPNGQTALINRNVWTAVDTSGVASGSSCSDWTSNSGFGSRGLATSTTSTWTDSNQTGCSSPNRLYCVEQ